MSSQKGKLILLAMLSAGTQPRLFLQREIIASEKCFFLLFTWTIQHCGLQTNLRSLNLGIILQVRGTVFHLRTDGINAFRGSNIQIQPGLKAKIPIIFIVCSNKIIIKSCNAERRRQLNGENGVLVHFFFTAAHSHLGGRYHFSFSHRRYKIVMLFFQKNVSFVFYLSLQLSVALSFLVELRWSIAYFLFFFVYSKFVDMAINLSLILQTTRIQKQFPLSVFVFIDSLVVSALQDSGGYAISRQNNLKLHLGCHTR